MWELDPVEGTAGWNPGKPMPGNLNMAYSTETLGIATCPESTVLGLLEESSWPTLVHTELVQVVQHKTCTAILGFTCIVFAYRLA